MCDFVFKTSRRKTSEVNISVLSTTFFLGFKFFFVFVFAASKSAQSSCDEFSDENDDVGRIWNSDDHQSFVADDVDGSKSRQTRNKRRSSQSSR